MIAWLSTWMVPDRSIRTTLTDASFSILLHRSTREINEALELAGQTLRIRNSPNLERRTMHFMRRKLRNLTNGKLFLLFVNREKSNSLDTSKFFQNTKTSVYVRELSEKNRENFQRFRALQKSAGERPSGFSRTFAFENKSEGQITRNRCERSSEEQI